MDGVERRLEATFKLERRTSERHEVRRPSASTRSGCMAVHVTGGSVLSGCLFVGDCGGVDGCFTVFALFILASRLCKSATNLSRKEEKRELKQNVAIHKCKKN